MNFDGLRAATPAAQLVGSKVLQPKECDVKVGEEREAEDLGRTIEEGAYDHQAKEQVVELRSKDVDPQRVPPWNHRDIIPQTHRSKCDHTPVKRRGGGPLLTRVRPNEAKTCPEREDDDKDYEQLEHEPKGDVTDEVLLDSSDHLFELTGRDRAVAIVHLEEEAINDVADESQEAQARLGAQVRLDFTQGGGRRTTVGSLGSSRAARGR